MSRQQRDRDPRSSDGAGGNGGEINQWGPFLDRHIRQREKQKNQRNRRNAQRTREPSDNSDAASDRSSRRRLNMNRSTSVTVTPQGGRRTRSVLDSMDLLASTSCLARPVSERQRMISNVANDIVAETDEQGIEAPPSPSNDTSLPPSQPENVSPLTQSPVSPPLRHSLLRLIDNPADIRFRVMVSPGKGTIVKFDKEYFYGHGYKEPVDLGLKSNTEIIDLKLQIQYYVSKHMEFVPDDRLHTGTGLFIKKNRYVIYVNIIFIVIVI